MAAILEALNEEGIEQIPRAHRVFRERTDPLDQYSDSELRRKYRFSREGLERLIEIIGPRLQSATNRYKALTPSTQIFTALDMIITSYRGFEKTHPWQQSRRQYQSDKSYALSHVLLISFYSNQNHLENDRRIKHCYFSCITQIESRWNPVQELHNL